MKAITSSAVLAALAGHIGHERGVAAAQLVSEILGLAVSDPVEERRLRRIVEELRREGHHICGHPAEGYYLAHTAEELEATCRFLYDRAMTSLSQIAAMKRISLPDLAGQLKLKT